MWFWERRGGRAPSKGEGQDRPPPKSFSNQAIVATPSGAGEMIFFLAAFPDLMKSFPQLKSFEQRIHLIFSVWMFFFSAGRY